jgi:tetratricopeptide (TPR) repeat protein/transcriptional regulator with XRE-family HTH domain
VHTNWTPLPAHITGPARELTEQLRTLKDASGWTLTEFGTRTHYARSSWERWFNGKRLITRSALTSLALTLAIDGAPLLELLERAESALAEEQEGRDRDGLGGAGFAQAAGGQGGQGLSVAGAAAVAQLPVAVIDFAGRSTHIRTLCQALTTRDRGPGQTPIAVLTGAGGMGKTTLAVHVAHLLAESFPDGQFFIDLHGMELAPLDPARALYQCLLDLGIAPEAIPDTIETRAARLRSLMSGRRFLMVLDNARDAAQVRPLLPASEGCAVLVTSRSMLSGLVGAEHFGLSVLPLEEGRELFSKIVGDTRTSAEPDAATEIVQLCAGLPLGIRIAATRLAARPGWLIRDIAGRLTAEHRRLAELATEDLAVRASFRLSYDGLAGEVAHAFRVLGLVPSGTFELPATAALLGLSAAEAERVLETLTDANMLEAPSPGTYKLHDLLRLFAAELAAADLAEDDRDAALERLVRWYAVALQSVAETVARNRQLPPGRMLSAEGVPTFGSHNEALAWCRQEQDSLTWAIRSAAAAGQHEIAARIGALLGVYSNRSGAVWVEDLYLIGLNSARRLGDVPVQAWLLAALGALTAKLEHDEEGIAWLRQAMSLYEELGDKLGKARVINDLGTAHHNLGRFEPALEYFEQAETLFDALGLDQMRAMSLSNAGTVCRSMGAYDQALARYTQALEIRRRTGDRHGEGATRTALGTAYRLMAEPAESLAQLHAAVAIQRDLGTNHWWLLTALDELGLTLAETGRTDEAMEAWTEAAVLAEEANDPRAAEFRGRPAVG